MQDIIIPISMLTCAEYCSYIINLCHSFDNVYAEFVCNSIEQPNRSKMDRAKNSFCVATIQPTVTQYEEITKNEIIMKKKKNCHKKNPAKYSAIRFTIDFKK